MLTELDNPLRTNHEKEALRLALDALQEVTDPLWVALMNRGRKRKPGESKARSPLSRAERQRCRRAALFFETSRKIRNAANANDRRYRRGVEALVKRMSTEDLDRFMHGEEF